MSLAEIATAPAPRTTTRPRPARAFLGLLWRDIFVTGRELPSFLAQVVLQPLFLLFVLGKVLGDLGYTRGGFSDVLFPGIVAFTAFLTSLQTTALPLVIDFSFTKEIEDRLLAPLPTAMVALEKIVFSMLRALVAAAVIFPLGRWILGPLGVSWSEAPTIALFLVLGSLVAAALGLTLGTLVSASKINIVFALVLTPLLFTGSTQFPWSALSNLRWFQVLCACNPLTYVSEGVRGAMVSSVRHIPAWVCVLVLLGFLALFSATGIRGFRRRAVD
jgi:ABC-2 type transport system permease protein